ncbi:MAG: phosphatase PAP2 family protein [Bacteroidales bacterium]|nr:phosphatase PAP2 family protein [Bacteroidales bacterium]
MKLTPLWSVILVYQVITILLIAFCDVAYFKSGTFLISRLTIVMYLIFRFRLRADIFKKNRLLTDTLIIYVLLAYFYVETAHLNTFLFSKIDPLLAMADQWIFGYQPSVMFSAKFSHVLFSEWMFLGYFSYYLMPLIAFFAIWKYRRDKFEEFSFFILTAYFVYYLIFILLPAEGPQFFFPEPLNQISSQGVFSSLVKLIQQNGEAPTAAFPSSHIGVTVIMLVLLFKYKSKLFKIYLPFATTLLFSTVYIKAHYFIDVLAGLISAPLVLSFNKYIYQKLSFFSNRIINADTD